MSISRIEQETVILFNEDEATASVQTYNGTLKRKLAALCESYPEQAQHTRTDEHGGMYFTIPKRWVRVNAGRMLSSEIRAEMAQRARERFGGKNRL